MKKKKILSMAIFAVSIMVTTSGILSVGNFTGKGQVVAATVTATSTATDTPYYPNYIPLSNTTVEGSLDFSEIQNRSQIITINERDIDPNWVVPQYIREIDTVTAVFPQEFISQEKLQGKFWWIHLAYDNVSYNTYEFSKESAELLIKNGYKVIDKLYDFKLILSNGGQSLVTQFDKPITITISLSDSEINGFDKSKLKVLYVDDNGNIEVIPNTINGNDITFSTTHFSTYYIGQVQDTTTTATPTLSSSVSTKTTTSAKTSDSNNMIRVVSFALGSIVLATTVTILGIKKRKNGMN